MQSFKNLLFILLLFLAFSSSGQDSPSKGMSRPFISLAGAWQSDLGEVSLPGTIDESRLSARTKDTTRTIQLTRLHPFEGKMRYTRKIEITDHQEDYEWRLIMERTKPSVVWVDGDSIGSSQLLLSPQIYDIGRLSAGIHTITMEINNNATSVPKGIMGSHAWTDATQTNWNGVIGRFGLEGHQDILINSIQVYPSTGSSIVPVEARIKSAFKTKSVIHLTGKSWNTANPRAIPTQEIPLNLEAGEAVYKFTISLGDSCQLWSEFSPTLYQIAFELECGTSRDQLAVDFGVRDFRTKGPQFSINSLTTFLRGKHDACVFPLTGYPPMEKKEWIRQFRIAKEYGVNHYRFHSWTPPQAAFDAANEEGIYMQAELPYWGWMDRNNSDLNNFLIREGQHIVQHYGNNPSFVMMALGNELDGDVGLMREIVEDLRSRDSRRLYAFGANNSLGVRGQQEGEDFLVTCRVGGQVGSSDYTKHTRSSFSFADAADGGYMNALYPSTDRTFADAVKDCTVPIVSHENGQFQVYPDYEQIKKYTGVLYPYNLQVFKKRLHDNGMLSQAEAFHKASARFAAICYKEDIEMCFRTANFGGFQVLDLQDYPGQGSAYVGLLDAFMDSKGAITPNEFRGFCDRVVPLLLLPKYCWTNTESFTAQMQVANYGAHSMEDTKLLWSLRKADGRLIKQGEKEITLPQGQLTTVGDLDISLKSVARAEQLTVTLQVGSHVNDYTIWVYPEQPKVSAGKIAETTSLEEALEMLAVGKKVLYVPKHSDVEKMSVAGLFTPDYWNFAMFKNISEKLNRKVSPGTLSVLTDPAHPLFKDFPTQSHSNWQWWIITKHSRPLILDNLKGYQPLVQVIDNIERNHRLGMLFEFRVGTGKLLVSMCDLEAVKEKPEGRQLNASIHNYINSSAFAPETQITAAQLKDLFHAAVQQRDNIQLDNITDYK